MSKAPKEIRPYLFHGVDIDWTEDDPMTECPFCGKHKFAINVERGLARCWVCGISGSENSEGLNPSTFIQQFHKLLEGMNREKFRLQSLAERRGLVRYETLLDWGVVFNLNEPLIPAYNEKGTLCQLYRYTTVEGGKRTCLPTPTLGAQMFGVHLVKKKTKVINITEGVWDAMALYECVKDSGQKEDVIGIPGALTFKPQWSSLFSGKIVNIWQDNDHSKMVDGAERGLGGLKGAIKIASILSRAKKPPEKINYLEWGPEGWSLDVPNKTDARDVITGAVEI